MVFEACLLEPEISKFFEEVQIEHSERLFLENMITVLKKLQLYQSFRIQMQVRTVLYTSERFVFHVITNELNGCTFSNSESASFVGRFSYDELSNCFLEVENSNYSDESFAAMSKKVDFFDNKRLCAKVSFQIIGKFQVSF